MKNLTIIFLLIATSCSKQIEINPTSAYTLEEMKKIEENTRILLAGPDWDMGFTTNNAFSDTPQRPGNRDELWRKYMLNIYRNDQAKIHWKQLNKMITEDYTGMIGEGDELTLKEMKYTISIQSISLAFIKDFLMPEKLSKKIADEIIHHLNILHKHKAVELKIMSEALVHVREYMEKGNYSVIKNYLVVKANEDTKYVKDNWKDLHQKYLEAEGVEKQNYLLEGKHLSNMSKVSNYVRDLLGEVN